MAMVSSFYVLHPSLVFSSCHQPHLPTFQLSNPRNSLHNSVAKSCFFPIRASLATETEERDATPKPTEVEQSVSLLKTAARSKKVPPTEVYAAMRVLEQAKADPSGFLNIIGGTESPGRTWMLVFTTNENLVKESLKGGPGGGQYFPITAVQRFDAAAMQIENGAYFGPLGFITFQGRFSWEKRILAFVFETLNIKIGSLGPFKFNLEKKQDQGRIPSKKDPFFIWFYADEEIIVGKGKSGGVAFWCRCKRVPSS